MKKPVIVIKFGSASLTTDGEIDEHIVLEIARQCAQLRAHYNIVLVSSGAVTAGKKYILNYSGTVAQRKAAAAIGNPLLMRTYGSYFHPFKIAIAQSLCERHHFANRRQFLQLKNTYETLWKNNIIPIANENDVVSDKELKFSDNDELATLIALGFGADQLLFGTTVSGVLDREGEVLKCLEIIDKTALSLARKETSGSGLGGMVSKLNFARLATRMGIRVVVFSAREPDGILKAVEGTTGTVCLPFNKRLSSRNKWLVSGSLIAGLIQVDRGAIDALEKRKSLLAVGVIDILQGFQAGEVVQIVDENRMVYAVAKSKIDSDDLRSLKDRKKFEIAHADDIVLL
ncbi:MAG: glutamate 5-kinase [Sphingobacterium sp.]